MEVRRGIAAFAALVTLAGVVVSNASAHSAPAQLRGKPVILHADYFGHGRATYTHMLETSRGTYVAADGRSSARSGSLSSRRTAGSSMLSGLPSGAKKVAVILFTFADNTTQPYTPAYAQEVAFTNPDSVAAYYQAMSWGKLTLTGDVFGWYSIPSTSTTCNYTQWAASADQAAVAAGVDLSAYDNKVYGFPTVSACGWSGTSEMPGTRSWVKGWPGMSLGVMAHELGHAFGSNHASSYSCTQGGVRVALSTASNCTSSEYGDPFSVMGTAPRGHTNFSRASFGWLPSADTLDVSLSGSYSLAPIEPNAAADVQAIRIRRDTSTYLLLEFRQPVLLFDNFLPTDPVVNGVTVRIVPSYTTIKQSQLVDTTPGTTTFTDAPLAAGRSLSDPVSGVTITTQSISSLAAAVQITFGAGSTQPDSQPPTAPASLSASATDPTDIRLSWSPSTDNTGVTGYKIYRGGTYVATSTSTSYTDAGLAPNTAYSYGATAVDAAGNESAPSTTATTTPPLVDTTPPTAPTGLKATAIDINGIALAWTASTDSVGVTGYRIYRGGLYIGTSALTSYTDAGLTPNTNYGYYVKAVDAAGNQSVASSTASAKTTDLTAPSVPTSLKATQVDVFHIALTWGASTDNVGVTGYKLYRNGAYLKTVTSTSYTDGGLLANTIYSYYVTARDYVGNASAPSNTASAVTLDSTPPSTPALLGKKLNATDGYLYWSASTDNAKVTGYRLYRNGVLLATISPGTRNYTDKYRPTGTDSYRVVAFDGAGNTSASSNTVSLTF